jgi:outer membrane protein OmpA-like peptidoglycan-associated protein
MEVRIWRNRLAAAASYLIIVIALTGCASSNTSRDAANQVDSAYQNSSDFFTTLSEGGVDAYPNASQIAQGAAVGAVTGAGVGAVLASGVGGVLPGAAGGAVIGGIMGAFIQQNSSLIDDLENHGVKVFIMGDQIMLVLQGHAIFRDGSTALYPSATSTLDLVVKLLNRFTTMAVKVTGYRDGSEPKRVAYALSKQQADVIMKYLWKRVNTRVLYSAAGANTNLVSPEGSGANYRIEIKTEKLPV